ncbi:hypothetical protein [Pedobacter cryophilus]|uniref:Uncharacterized protein n=1 Tax=Pedobacter cryophilus TaxID=2571271 RepID=A0A4U1BVM8_9SPHI|nr:hypothetical protein [Pedobacter cryophilus]TKB96855.1 hypothetical protein FA046_12315 [Pedobacter cryophilus]
MEDTLQINIQVTIKDARKAILMISDEIKTDEELIKIFSPDKKLNIRDHVDEKESFQVSLSLICLAYADHLKLTENK